MFYLFILNTITIIYIVSTKLYTNNLIKMYVIIDFIVR